MLQYVLTWMVAGHMLGWLNNSKRMALRSDKATNSAYLRAVESTILLQKICSLTKKTRSNSVCMDAFDLGLQCLIFAAAN